MKKQLILNPEWIDEIVEIIIQRLIERIKPLLSNNSKNQDDIIFDLKGLASYLCVTPKWIYERTHLKEIPFYKLGNKQIRFRKRDIDKWLDTLKTPAINQFTGRLRAIK